MSCWSSGIFQVGIKNPGTSAQSGSDSLKYSCSNRSSLAFLFLDQLNLDTPFSMCFCANCDPCELKIIPLVQL